MAWTGDAKFCVSTGLTPLLNIGGNSISLCAGSKSRDAKSCVSQGSSANIVIGLSHAYIAMDCSGDSWNEDLESNYKQHQLNCRGRETQDFASLLRGYAFIVSGLFHIYVGMGCSGDAKFCVSTGLAPLFLPQRQGLQGLQPLKYSVTLFLVQYLFF